MRLLALVAVFALVFGSAIPEVVLEKDIHDGYVFGYVSVFVLCFRDFSHAARSVRYPYLRAV